MTDDQKDSCGGASHAAVTFVVVNWNGRHLLEHCIPAILRQSFRDFELIVVDNGSCDGSREYLHGFPEVRVIELAGNHGYGPPSNLAFARARSEWVATVNNDMVLDPDWLLHLVREMERDPDCFAVQGRNMQAGDGMVIDGCGIGLRACGAARRLFHNRGDGPAIGAPVSIFAVSSGAALYRRRMLAELGYFDPSYFIYYEDLDIGWRARLRGWHSMLAPQAVARHHGHATSLRGGSERLWYLGERNRLRTLIKNLPLGALLRHPLLIGLDELRYVFMIRKKVGLWTLIKARLAVLTELVSLWRRRPGELKMSGRRAWRQWLTLGETAGGDST